MRIGDLYFKGQKISDIHRMCMSKSCEGCKYNTSCSGICDLSTFTNVEVELPPIIKAADAVHNHDNVNHPEHYQGKHECIDIMLAMFGQKAVKGFCMCNAYKYRFRADKKNGKEDIAKAEWYENKLIELSGDVKND